MAADAGTIMRARQADAFRIGMRDAGLTFKQLAYRCDLPERTLRSWASGEALMPFCAIDGLLAALPGHAVDLLLPDGFALVAVPAGVNHADVASAVMDYAASYSQARHPDSEQGEAIGPGEDAALSVKAARLSAVGGVK